MTSTVTWGRNAAYANATRLADSYQNRAYLQQQAAQDGTPSAVVKMGNDVALLSGDALRTASRLSTSYNGVTGKIEFDEKGDIKNGALTLMTYKGGQRTTIAVIR